MLSVFWPVRGGKTVFSFQEVLFRSFWFSSASWSDRALGWVCLIDCSDFREDPEWKTLLFGVGFVVQLHVASLWLCSSIFSVILRPLLAVPLNFGLFMILFP